MLETILLGVLLAEVPTVLLALYWGGMIVGGGLLFVSLLGGHSDADVDVDVGVDVDADLGMDVDVDGGADFDVDVHADAGDVDLAHGADAVHGGMASLASWFSIRFVVFFMAVFGTTGVILTHLSSVGWGTTLAVALVVGLAVGQAVHQLIRYIRRTSGDSAPRPQDYVHKLGRVTIAVSQRDKGEVALQVRGARRFVPAVTGGATERFGIGEEVVVVGYRAGIAQVISQDEYERRARSR